MTPYGIRTHTIASLVLAACCFACESLDNNLINCLQFNYGFVKPITRECHIRAELLLGAKSRSVVESNLFKGCRYDFYGMFIKIKNITCRRFYFYQRKISLKFNRNITEIIMRVYVFWDTLYISTAKVVEKY